MQQQQTQPAGRPAPAAASHNGAAMSGTMEGGGSTATSPRKFPPMPQIGRPEAHYAKVVHHADKHEDPHEHAAGKVGQYVTLALDPHKSWEEKLKYFRHALKRHCQPPPFPDEEVWMFYHQLADVVRQWAGQEALRLASQEDDLYAARLAMGQGREKIEDEAEAFFGRLMGHFEHHPANDSSGESSLLGHVLLLDTSDASGEHCPEWFNEEDWAQLKLIRDQWI